MSEILTSKARLISIFSLILFLYCYMRTRPYTSESTNISATIITKKTLAVIALIMGLNFWFLRAIAINAKMKIKISKADTCQINIFRVLVDSSNEIESRLTDSQALAVCSELQATEPGNQVILKHIHQILSPTCRLDGIQDTIASRDLFVQTLGRNLAKGCSTTQL